MDYTYDEAHNLLTVTDWLSQVTSYDYDNAGKLTTTTLPSATGIETTFGYDASGRLTSIDHDQGMTTLMSFTYTLNALGNRTQIVDDTGTSTFTYDPLSRLTSASYPGPTTDTYTYDAVGNRTAKNATSYTYDDADQMTAVGGVSYTYDNNGNQITRGVSDTFTWDHENRLVATSLGSSTYDYNSDGLRVSRTSNSVTTDYVWDVNRSIPVILQDGTNTYVYGRGLISATDSSGDQTYRLIDGLGSTVGLCDGSGTMLGTYAYDAFGIIRAQTGSIDNYFLFTGEQRDDESGYDYLRARYYDSEVGRFLGQDVASPDWAVPGTLNRFTYVLNNPLVLVDPSGMITTCVMLFCHDEQGYVTHVFHLDPAVAMRCYPDGTCSMQNGLVLGVLGTGLVKAFFGCTRYDPSDYKCMHIVYCDGRCNHDEFAANNKVHCHEVRYCAPVEASKLTSFGSGPGAVEGDVIANAIKDQFSCGDGFMPLGYACSILHETIIEARASICVRWPEGGILTCPRVTW